MANIYIPDDMVEETVLALTYAAKLLARNEDQGHIFLDQLLHRIDEASMYNSENNATTSQESSTL